MNDVNPLVNRVTNSGIKTINLEEYFPKTEMIELDLKPFLFKELILKEKDFRLALKEHDWNEYEGKVLLVFCSSDAIIPMWAYMLVSAAAAPIAADVFQGDRQTYLTHHFKNVISQVDYSGYEGDRVVIKGCGEKDVPASAYQEITRKLQLYAQSIMYGEPCSTVPIFKRPRVLDKR